MVNKAVIGLIILSLVPELLFAFGNQPKGHYMLDRKIESQSLSEKNLRSYYSAGAATMNFADTLTISDAAIGVDVDRSDVPVMVQTGSGQNLYGLTARSYYKLSDISTVWGHAAYHNGRIRDIALSDVIGYESVAPFVIGDAVGGHVNLQQYDFGGGWSRTFGAWTMGLKADYSATIAHRSVDPRVRNIVSDLNVAIGGARSVTSRYLLALDCGATVYHQDTDVDFYNPVNHVITTVFTGLGSTSSRFRGADAQNSSNKLTAFHAILQFLPKTHSESFYGSIKGEVLNSDLILNSYNNLKFGTTSTRTLDCQVSRLFRGSTLTLFPTVSGHYFSRVATENLFGSSADNYEKIGERSNYHHDRYAIIVDIPATWQLKSSRVWLNFDLQGGYTHTKEYLVDPARRLMTDHINARFAADATKRFGSNWSVGIGVAYAAKFVASSSAEWAGLDLSSPEGMMTEANFRMSACDIASQQVNLVVSRSISAVVLSLSVGYMHSDYKSISKADSFQTNLSLTF